MSERPQIRYKPVKPDPGMIRLLALRDQMRMEIAHLEGQVAGVEAAMRIVDGGRASE